MNAELSDEENYSSQAGAGGGRRRKPLAVAANKSFNLLN
jgi:hypothetical protein